MMNRFPKLRSLVTAVGVGAALLIVAMVGGRPATSYAAPVSVLDVPVLHCPLHCDYCNAQHTKHLTHYVVEGADAEGVLHGSCWPGSCWVHECETDPGGDDAAPSDADATFVAAWDAFRGAADDDLGSVLHRYPQYFRVNASRGALQVLACNGEVFATVPVQTSVLERLLSHQP